LLRIEQQKEGIAMRLLDELLQEALETSGESLELGGGSGESSGRDTELYPELFPELSPETGTGEAPFARYIANEFEQETPRLGQIVAPPRPNIGDFVDYLDATVVARGRVTVPTQKINFLVKLDPPGKPTWWKRLWEDPLKFFPKVTVTVELVRVGASLFPFSNYATGGVLVQQGINDYLLKLNSVSCGGFATALGGGFLITTQATMEKEMEIPGQLDGLLKQANVKLPMSAADQQKHFWIVYATFPDGIKKYLIPEDRVLLDQFDFDKSLLTKNHIAKIIAIARHLVAVSKIINTPKVLLTGHTDIRGTEKYNAALGDRRISAVKDALVKAIGGIVPGRSSQVTILTKSFGETKPLIGAKNEAEHAQNRRVEVFLPKLQPRCPRVSLRAVIDRALRLLPRLQSPETAKRLNCVLLKLKDRAVDDRWAYGQLVLDVFNNDRPFGTYSFSVLRDSLSMSSMYGPSVPDAQILRSLEQLDGNINQGIQTLNQYMQRLRFAASQGVPLISRMKATDALRAWMFERTRDRKSIYSCYP